MLMLRPNANELAGADDNHDREIVDELRGALSSLRRAIVTVDVENWPETFGPGDKVIRFGLSGNLCGPDQLEAFCELRLATNLERPVKDSTCPLRP